ncbi:hypothetical protein [Sphingomicrobium flavum]|uniref:hypothetical protein n=1 Tax=Sphingomicrobium flavum TaxID=1229164 RepID=UPI0021ADFAFC|nr:hypothetical protein [Sphingomicrobium flavum]
MNKRDIIAAGSVVLHEQMGHAIVDAGVFPIGFTAVTTGGAFHSSADAGDDGVFVLFENVPGNAFNDFIVTMNGDDFHLLATIQRIGSSPYAYDVSFTLLGN